MRAVCPEAAAAESGAAAAISAAAAAAVLAQALNLKHFTINPKQYSL